LIGVAIGILCRHILLWALFGACAALALKQAYVVGFFGPCARAGGRAARTAGTGAGRRFGF
jgi:ABC-type cobalamin transport system permease subunit